MLCLSDCPGIDCSSPQTSPERRQDGSARLLDRFIPVRDHSVSTAERYHTAKQSRALSPSERLTRHGSASLAFLASSHEQGVETATQSLAALSMTAPSYRPRTGRGLPCYMSKVSANDANLKPPGNTTILPATPPHQGEQRAHRALLRTVDRSTLDDDTAVNDGLGNLLRRGTNARLVASSSLVARPSAREDLESYQGRVAYALGIDRLRRILDFSLCLPASSMSSRFGRGPPRLTKPTCGSNEWPEPERWRTGFL